MSSNDAKLGWLRFLGLCQKSHSIEQLDELFNLFFTLEEKDALATRVLLVQELLQKSKTQREIAQMLNISIAKITRGSNALKTIPEELKQFLLEQISTKDA